MTANLKKAHSSLEKLEKNIREISLTNKASLIKYSYDNSKISNIPDVVFQPISENQISNILKVANKYCIPIVCRGAGSVPTGAASAINKSWVIDLSNLNKIKIHKNKKLAEVEAGAITLDIQNKAEEKGLFYPPDPSSKKFSTIGGNINTNAGGLRGAKYGVTRDYVVALEGFFASGKKFKFSLPLKKFTVGYNLKDLLIGSEGTLAVVTRAYLRLIEKKKYKNTIIAYFIKLKDAINTIDKINFQDNVPAIMELLNKTTIKCLKKAYPDTLEIKKNIKAITLIEIESSNKKNLKINTEKIIQILNKYSTKYTKTSNKNKNLKKVERIWHIRRSCSQAMYKIKNSKLNQDVVVPIDKIHNLIKFTKKCSKKYNTLIAVFGHAGDGNLHVNILFDKLNKTESDNAKKSQRELMEFVTSQGGAISGEHGIGITKSMFLTLHLNNDIINLQKKIKKIFDPKNILNPNKIFYPVDHWKLKKINAKMPWDNELTN